MIVLVCPPFWFVTARRTSVGAIGDGTITSRCLYVAHQDFVQHNRGFYDIFTWQNVYNDGLSEHSAPKYLGHFQ